MALASGVAVTFATFRLGELYTMVKAIRAPAPKMLSGVEYSWTNSSSVLFFVCVSIELFVATIGELTDNIFKTLAPLRRLFNLFTRNQLELERPED